MSNQVFKLGFHGTIIITNYQEKNITYSDFFLVKMQVMRYPYTYKQDIVPTH